MHKQAKFLLNRRISLTAQNEKKFWIFGDKIFFLSIY